MLDCCHKASICSFRKASSFSTFVSQVGPHQLLKVWHTQPPIATHSQTQPPINHTQPHIATHSHTWQHIATHSNTYPPITTQSYLWSHIANQGHTYLHIVTRSHKQPHIAAHSYTQPRIATHSYPQRHIAARSFTQPHIATSSRTQLHVQYCAKEMQTKFGVFRSLFSRKFDEISSKRSRIFVESNEISLSSWRNCASTEAKFRFAEVSSERNFARAKIGSCEISSKRNFAGSGGVMKNFCSDRFKPLARVIYLVQTSVARAALEVRVFM